MLTHFYSPNTGLTVLFLNFKKMSSHKTDMQRLQCFNIAKFCVLVLKKLTVQPYGIVQQHDSSFDINLKEAITVNGSGCVVLSPCHTKNCKTAN